MSKIIDGELIAEKINDITVSEITGGHIRKDLNNVKRPNLAIVLVGKREDSKIYVQKKEEGAKRVGIDTHLYKCDDDATTEQILEVIDFLNKDETVDAILVQLPLPKQIDTNEVINEIDPAKDVDRFHPDNQNYLKDGKISTRLLPPVFAVVLEMLGEIEVDMKDKEVCIIANSDLFGKNLANVMEQGGAKVTVARAKDEDLKDKTTKADVLISIVGKPKFIKKDMIKKDAVIIDVGITKVGEEVQGDVDFEDVSDKCSYITPVPGGVGPLTIAMTFRNTLELFKERHK